jgi:hypothetical protein
MLFPAIKQYGAPWVRIVSCSENEIEDRAIAPYLSGCSEGDEEGFRRFRARSTSGSWCGPRRGEPR